MLNARIRQCKRFLILWIYVNFGDVLVKNSWGAILAPSREMLGKIIFPMFREKVTIFDVNHRLKGMLWLFETTYIKLMYVHS